MFEKTKDYYKEHKSVILTVGGVCVAGASLLLLKNKMGDVMNTYTEGKLKRLQELESIEKVFKDGCKIPFVTKEVASKFMESRGETYQVDILDDLTSVIWITK